MRLWSGLVLFIGISMVVQAADLTSNSFISRDSQPAVSGGRATSTAFESIGTAGQSIIGRQTSASFTNDIGIFYFNPGNPGTLTVTDRASPTTLGQSDFILSYPNADPYAKQFMVCSGKILADVDNNCTGSANRAFTTATNYTFSGLSNNTTYYFKVYPLSGYDQNDNPIIGPSPSATVSKKSGEASGSASGSSPGAIISPVPPPVVAVSGGGGGGGGVIGTIIQKVREFITPVIKPTAPVVEKSLVFQGNLPIIQEKKLEDLIFSPLPEKVAFLLKQFPELRKTFAEVGIEKIGSIAKLAEVKFNLPTLAQLSSLELPSGLPIKKISAAEQKKIPENVVFVRSPNEQIDLRTVLSFDKKGEPRQVVQSVAGEQLKLMVKPDKPAKSVDGFIVWQGKEAVVYSPIPISSLVASLVLAKESLADTGGSEKINKKLLVREFDYKKEGDLFTAEITTPQRQGIYDVISVINYKDKKLPSKNIELTTVVDPRGYVYEQTRRGRLRLENVKVTLYWLNSNTKKFEIWPAQKYQQENPQETNNDGDYNFLTPPGIYYLEALADGYGVYESEPIEVGGGGFVIHNVPLKRSAWWQRIFKLK